MLYRSERHFALEFADTGSAVRYPLWGGCSCGRGADCDCGLHHSVWGDCSYPPCKSGPCERGTKLCPSPEACQLADEPEYISAWQMLRAIFFGDRK